MAALNLSLNLFFTGIINSHPLCEYRWLKDTGRSSVTPMTHTHTALKCRLYDDNASRVDLVTDQMTFLI